MFRDWMDGGITFFCYPQKFSLPRKQVRICSWRMEHEVNEAPTLLLLLFALALPAFLVVAVR